jgi:aryl-alcohol dehydrogenase-like predicted oxidoreductase
MARRNPALEAFAVGTPLASLRTVALPLRRLKVERIDLLQLLWIDPTVPFQSTVNMKPY